MTVKDYLYSVRVSDKLIRTKEHELSKLRLNIAQVSVKQNEPVKTSGVNDPMRIVDRIADLQAEINREIDNLVRLKTEIRSKINALDDYRYIAILTEYYINCQRWEDIAEYGNERKAYSEIARRSVTGVRKSSISRKIILECH